MNDVPLVQYQGPLYGVVQLPHIAGPGMPDQGLPGVVGQGDAGELHLATVLPEQMAGQRQDVQRAFPQGLPVHRENRQTVVQILPEAALTDRFRQVPVGGRNHPDIQGDGLASAHPFHFPFLKNPEQLGLQSQFHFRNLIQQESPAVGLLELARRGRHRAGKGAFFVTKQNGLQHVLGNGGAVDRHERLPGSWGMLMDVSGQHLLAGTALAGNQNRGIRVRHLGRQLEHALTDRVFRHRLVRGGPAYTAHHPGHRVHQHLGLERLDQVVDGSGLHRSHRVADLAIGGNQHHRQPRVPTLHLGQQLVA